MSGNFLEKNLACIESYNPDFATKIRENNDLSNASYNFTHTKCDDVNLVVNGVLIHDSVDPIEEANRIWKTSISDDNKVVQMIFGLGLGYLVKRYTSNPEAKVLIYEPNLDILRITLEVVDFSLELSNPNVRVIEDKFTLKSMMEKVYKKDDKISLSFLNSYKRLYAEELSEFIEELKVVKSLFNTGYSELAKKSFQWATTTSSNLHNICSNNELEAIRNKFDNKPAVIVSAGPSLLKSVEYIKQYRDKIVVICVNTALKALIRQGVTPDFVCIVESDGCVPTIEGVDVSNINFILPPEVNPGVYGEDIGPAFNYYTENILTSDWVQSLTNIDCTSYMNRGTVSIIGLWSAKMMGCNPIILTGQDLSFSGGKCYAGDAALNIAYRMNSDTGKYEIYVPDYDKALEQVKNATKYDDETAKESLSSTIQRKNDALVTVKAQDGSLIPTTNDYALFIKHFEELIPELKGIKLINCSEGGAQIDGYENRTMKDVLEEFATEKIDVKKIIDESIESYNKPYDSASIVSEIDKNISMLKVLLNKTNKSLDAMKKFNNNYKRQKHISQNLNALWHSIGNSYVEFVYEYMGKNRLIMAMLYRVHIIMEDILTGDDKNNILKLLDSYSLFFRTSHDFSIIFIELLNKEKEKILNEGIDPKS